MINALKTLCCGVLQGVFIANQLAATGTDGPFGLKVGTGVWGN
jgi:hypothetical protein